MDERTHMTPFDLGIPPRGAGPSGKKPDRDNLLRQLAALHEKDWLLEGFGAGEATEFLRRCTKEKLTLEQALERLAEQAPSFHDPDQLELVASELGRHSEAGPIFKRLVTTNLLGRIHHTR
jgi:hypothetical protein